MQYDADRAGDLALALLFLTLHDGTRVWKGVDWDVLAHLHARGLIEDPRNRAKSLVLTEAGLERAEAMFREYLAPAG